MVAQWLTKPTVGLMKLDACSLLPPVRTQGCAVIRNFTANNESGKILIGRTGGVPVVVTAMTQFPNELVVQEQVGGVCNRQGNTGGLINSCLRPRIVLWGLGRSSLCCP